MRKSVLGVLLMACCLVLVAGNALAIPLGTNITISDEVYTGTGWWSDREDQEVEPGCVTGQTWDLEGFFLDGSTLTMVGGFDFKNGEPDPYPWRHLHYDSGDIFIDTNGDAIYGSDIEPRTGNGIETIANADYKYDYVMDLDFDLLKYDVYALSNETLLSVYFGLNDHANPWRLEDGQFVSTDRIDHGNITFWKNLSDSDVTDVDGNELEGGTHYAASVDLSFLGAGQDFLAHFTYGCGNDNLMGSGTTPAPEPATMLLLGSGLIGLACVGRRKFRAGKIAK